MDKKQTKVEDILKTTVRKWTWAENVVGKTDNRGTKKKKKDQNREATEMYEKSGQRIRWRDEIEALTGAGWSIAVNRGG